MYRLLLALAVIYLACLNPFTNACTTFVITKSATADGSVVRESHTAHFHLHLHVMQVVYAPSSFHYAYLCTVCLT